MKDVSQKTSSESSALFSLSSSFSLHFSVLGGSPSWEGRMCPLTRRLRDAHRSHTVSLLHTGTAWCFSKDLIVSPRGGTTLYKSSQYLKTQFKVTGPAYKVALDFSSLLFYHDLKWAHHSNGLLAVLRTANPLSHLHSDAYAASPACHAPVELRLALQGQLRYHPQRPFPFFPPCIFSLMQLP